MRPLWNEKSVENGYGADMEWIWRNILKMKWSGVDLDYGWELGAEMEPKFGNVKTSSQYLYLHAIFGPERRDLPTALQDRVLN